MNKTLFIYIDESGNLYFTEESPNYFCLTSVVGNIAEKTIAAFHDKRNNLIIEVDKRKKAGQEIRTSYDLEYFHAAEDYQLVRDEVFNLIKNIEDIRVYSVITEKRKTHPRLQDSSVFYTKQCLLLMQGILYKEDISKYENIIIFFDSMPGPNNKKKAILKGIKTAIASFFRDKGISIPYTIVSHQAKSNFCLQIVDYICWAIFIKNDRGETRPYNEIKKFIVNEFYPFKDGKRFYY